MRKAATIILPVLAVALLATMAALWPSGTLAGPPHQTSGSADTNPSFGSAAVSAQTYPKGTAVTVLTLPAATGGNGLLTYSLSPTLPNGLVFNAATRTLTGTPTVGQAETTYTYTVTDDDGDTDSVTFTITVIGDYDLDDDGLIEVDSLPQLDAVRWDLNGDGSVDTGTSVADTAKYGAAFPNPATGMGCLRDHDSNTATPKIAGCIGYELTQDLDLDTNGSGATYTTSSTGVVTGDAGDTYNNGGAGWTPLGGHQETTHQDFTATFEGNDYTVSNLYINLATTGANDGNYVGLFGDLAATATIRNVGLVNPYVVNARGGAGYSRTGALAGRNNGGTVSGSYVSGGAVTGNQGTVAGLIYNMAGCLLGYSQGTVSDSYATCAATATGADDAVDLAGGLVGWSAGTVRDSYATGTVASDTKAGGLVGFSNIGGRVTDSHATGTVSTSGAGGHAGGLVGHSAGESTVTGSYATGAVSASGGGSYVGGLAGRLSAGGAGGKTVRASYATGAVSASGNGSYVGGLTGQIQRDFSIAASYAAGAVSASGGGTNHLGGLVGQIEGIGSSVTNSYWDTQTSGQTVSAAGVGKTTGELQSPTGYTGIYAGWNLNLDGQTGDDDPWYFGAANQYPVLRYGDHDWDDDGLIEVNRLPQLDAVRWDLNGDGVVDTGTSVADTAKYRAAFGGGITGMGCLRDHDDDTTTAKVAGCIGYELTQDLDFDENNDGNITSADDDYWNGGKGWKPIGYFTATFDGNDKAIANLFIKDTAARRVGLFGYVGTGGRVERLGVRDVNVTGSSGIGGLVGRNYGTISASYATGSSNGGGLVGRNYGTISASYATVSVAGAGGLVGVNNGTISASYATGPVTGRHDVRTLVGGLAGYNYGTINASYATGSVTSSPAAGTAGGLVGSNYGGTISASYATGSVTSSGPSGGLVGYNYDGTISASYWDTETTGQSTSAGGVGKTTRDLQSPGGYSGIYAAWNTNLDGVAGNDNPWDFGTKRQYPVLKYGGLVPVKQRQTAIRYDNWNAPVVGEPVVASLNVTDATGITWQWQSSTNGSTWTDIANATTATYLPVAADTANGGKFLRAKVSFTASASSQTLTTVNTAKVVASTTATTATTTALRPIVGNKVQYGISVTGAADYAWRWQRCDNAGMTTNCVYVAEATTATAEYTPVAGDVGKYLQAYAYYAANDAGKTWTRTETPVLGPVIAAPATSPSASQ